MYNEPLFNNFVSHNHAVYYWQMTENSIFKNDLNNYFIYTVIKKSCSIQNKGITWELTNSKILITVNLYFIIDYYDVNNMIIRELYNLNRTIYNPFLQSFFSWQIATNQKPV